MTPDEDIQSHIRALSGSRDERIEAQNALIAIGEPVVEPLLDLLDTGEGKSALGAAEVLGALADPRAFELLVATLTSSNPLLGGAALKGLLNYREPDPLPVLLDALPVTHIIVQQSIILALQRQPDPRAVVPLIAHLETADAPTLVCAIIQTLGILGDPQAIPAIRARQQDADHHVREWSDVVLKQLTGEIDAD